MPLYPNVWVRLPVPSAKTASEHNNSGFFCFFYFIHDRRRAEHGGETPAGCEQVIPPPPKGVHTWPHPGFTAGSRHTCAAFSYRCSHPAFSWRPQVELPQAISVDAALAAVLSVLNWCFHVLDKNLQGLSQNTGAHRV